MREAQLAPQSAANPSPELFSTESLPTAQPELKIGVWAVRNPGDFVAIAAEWDRLHAEAAVASVFNSWMWQYAWWTLYGSGRRLNLLVASRGSAIVGILPLYAETVTAFGLSVRMLRFIGCGGDTHPDDIGPLLALGHERAAARALADALFRMKDFDVLQLSDIDARSDFPAVALEAAAAAQMKCTVERSQRIVYIDLPRDWKMFLSSLSGRRRAQMRAKRARFTKEHGARFFVWQDAAQLDRAAERLAHLHRKRWAGASESFASPQYVDLHRAAMRECLERDRLRLYCLEIAGEIAAMLYCYRFRNRIFLVQAGFDPAYAKWSPGSVLLGHAIEHAIGEGNEAFDFLRGNHDYKEELATGSRETVCLTAYRPTIGAAAYRARRVYLARTKAKLAQIARTIRTGPPSQ